MVAVNSFPGRVAPGRNYLEHVADTISDWTREEEQKREAAKVEHVRPEGARSFPDADQERKHQIQQTLTSCDLLFPDLQTQEKEEPIIREGSLKVSKVALVERERPCGTPVVAPRPDRVLLPRLNRLKPDCKGLMARGKRLLLG